MMQAGNWGNNSNTIPLTNQEILDFCSTEIVAIDNVLNQPVIRIQDIKENLLKNLEYLEGKLNSVQATETDLDSDDTPDPLYAQKAGLLEKIEELTTRIAQLQSLIPSSGFVPSANDEESKVDSTFNPSGYLSTVVGNHSVESKNSAPPSTPATESSLCKVEWSTVCSLLTTAELISLRSTCRFFSNNVALGQSRVTSGSSFYCLEKPTLDMLNEAMKRVRRFGRSPNLAKLPSVLNTLIQEKWQKLQKEKPEEEKSGGCSIS